MLEKRVVTEGEALLMPSARIKFYQVSGNVFNFLLGTLLELLPLSGAKKA